MMRAFMRHPRYLLIMLIAIQCFTSCGDCYYIENDLHGMWQVVSVERFSTGKVEEPQGRLYYSFQRTMVMLSDVNREIPNSYKRYIAHFDFVGLDSVSMGDFRVRTTGEGNLVDKEVKVSLELLNKFGLYDDNTTFHMEQYEKKLKFTSDSACIVLRKY